MIIDLPSDVDFHWRGTDFLDLAWSSVLGLLRNLEDAEQSGDYWKAADRQLSMALALAQQGIEFLIKSLICGINPLLLLAAPVREWPQRDVPFADLKTVDALDLPKLHDAIITPPLPVEFVRQYGELRRQRNALLHTVDKRLSISAHEVIVAVLEASHHLLAPRVWLTFRNTSLQGSPESVAFSPDFVESLVIREALLALNILSRAEAVKYFGFDKRKRAYICLRCAASRRKFSSKSVRSAQLIGKLPAAVWCFICNSKASTLRRSCLQARCPGDVIAKKERKCLTCGTASRAGAT